MGQPLVLMLVAALPLVLLALIYVYISRGTTSYRHRQGDGRYREILDRYRRDPESRRSWRTGNAMERGAHDVYGDGVYTDHAYEDGSYDQDSSYDDRREDETYRGS